MHEANRVELLVSREAAVGLAGDGSGRIICSGGISTLAKGVEAQAFEYCARFIRDDGNGAQVVFVEVARERGAADVLNVHADETVTGRNQIVRPSHGPT